MSEKPASDDPTLLQAILKNALLLSVFALLTAGVMGLTYVGTKDRISAAERQAAEKALLEIVSPSGARLHDNELLSDTAPVAEKYWQALGLKNGGQYHIARRNGQAIAYLFSAVAPDGYSGEIKLLIGIDPAGKITGVRALAHKETPGLGDKIELKKSPWMLSFNGKWLDDNNLASWAVKKDGGEFDAFTGATITPRAVVKQVKRSLQSFADMQANHTLASLPQPAPQPRAEVSSHE